MSAYTSLDRAAPVAEAPRSAKVAWIVIGLAILVGTVMGFFLFFRAKDADIGIRQWMHTYDQRGAALSAEGCIHEAVAWFENTCDAPVEMCQQGVGMGVAHCLAAKDRSAECAALGSDIKDKKWTYRMCTAMGVDKKKKSKTVTKSCTTAWDAYATFCASGQKGIVQGGGAL